VNHALLESALAGHPYPQKDQREYEHEDDNCEPDPSQFISVNGK
jgi:hypothetical protein